MAVTDSQIISNCRAGKYVPVYLLMGEEDYFIDTLSDFFETAVVPEENKDFDQSVLYGRDVEMRSVVAAAQRYPMMSERQLVLVKEAQDIPTRENAWDLLSKYLEHPQDRTVLVFCYRHKSLDKRSKAYKAIVKCGVVYEAKPIKDSELPLWISKHVRANGYEITEKSANVISEYVGNNLCKVTNELSKVFVAEPKGTTIGDAIVEKHIGISKDYNVFELQAAIARRDIEKCNRIINNFAANPKNNPIQMVIPMLYAFVVKLMAYIQDPAGVRVYPPADYQVASRNYTLPKLASCIKYLYEADLKSKGVGNSGTTTDGELMKEMIFKIIH